MILIIGGAGAGKGAFARDALGISQEDIAYGTIDERPCVGDAQSLLRPADPQDASSIPDWRALAEPLCAKKAVLCDEVGCDLIPLDPVRAAWRESVGRLCCQLAAKATCVVRLTCGIPQIIKGSLPSGGIRTMESTAAPLEDHSSSDGRISSESQAAC
jgi:adenosyl cobinamide kinase/adenosyl cobinamide phosphate guanylyltransferase